MKQCNDCGAEKALSEFYDLGRNRPAPYCKPCFRARSRANYAANKGHVLARTKRYRLDNPERIQALLARWRDEHREVYLAHCRAYTALHNALKKGQLVRPGTCEECHVACKPHGAHCDYRRPLDVRWLCASCHKQWDIAEPKVTVVERKNRTSRSARAAEVLGVSVDSITPREEVAA